MFAFLKPANTLSTVVAALLEFLKAKVTLRTIKEILENHPDYPSILSISDALKQWKIESYTLLVEKEKLREIPVPFIAHLNGKEPFVLVTSIADGRIFYSKANRKSAYASIEEFTNKWSGNILIADPDVEKGVEEKNYEQNRRKEILLAYKFPFIAAIVLGVMALAITYQYNYLSTPSFYGFSLLLILKFAGTFITSLLLWYEVDKANPVLKKICSLGGTSTQTNCGSVLSSKHSKIFKIFSWSEIGFFYFSGGLLSLLTSGNQALAVLPILAWLNVLALPYTFFSIYYQWRVVKQWCVLCLTVQGVLILEFIVFLSSHQLIHLASYSVNLLPSFLLPLTWYLIKPVLLQNHEARQKKRELLRFKYDSRIFSALLSKQKKLIVDTKGLGITIGNSNAANTIIKVCNPYCGPCAKAHPQIEELLEANHDLKVQIIFTATNDEKDKASLPVKHLLAIADKDDETFKKKSLDDWYLPEKKDYNVFAAKYPMNGELKKQETKVDAMSKWCKQTEIAFTPTFFINGYQLPDVYSIGDLKYFLGE